MNQISSLLWTQVWQVTAVAILVLIAVKLFAKDKPHLAHVLWAIVLIKCITPPIFSSPTSPFSWWAADRSTAKVVQPIDAELIGEIETVAESPNTVTLNAPGLNLRRKEGEVSRSAVTVPPAPPVSEKPVAVNWKRVLFGVWLLGTAFCLLWQSCRLLRLKFRLKRTELPASPEIEAIVRKLSAQLKLKRKVKVLITTASIGPAVIGLFRPKILLPSAIVNRQPLDELEHLIAHELIHIRRGDLWWVLLQTAAGSLFWFHPLVRFAVAGISHESERSCDEETVASLGCLPADYARCLLNVLEQKHRLRSAPALPGVKPIEITSARLERVMKLGQGSHKRTPLWTWAVLIACCAIALPGAALVFAQETSDKPDTQESEAQESSKIGSPALSETQESPTDLMLIKVYVIDHIIADMRKKQPEAEVQELELRLLRYLKAYRSHDLLNSKVSKSSERTTIDRGNLVATRTAAGHELLLNRLQQIEKHGLRNIVIATRVIKSDSGMFDDLNWEKSPDDSFESKQGVVHRKVALGGPIVAASFDAKAPQKCDTVNTATLIGDSNLQQDVIHELRDTKVSNQPVFRAMLDEESMKAFLKRINQEERSLMISAPTLKILDGQQAVIRDSFQRPFVTGVDEIKGENSTAHSPLISLLSDGTAVTVSAESVSETEIKFEAEVVLSKITDVKTFTFLDHTPGSGVSIQLPELAGSRMKFAGTVEENSTLLVRTSNPDDRNEDLIFVMSPKLVDAEVAETERAKAAALQQNQEPETLNALLGIDSGLSHVRLVPIRDQKERFEIVCFENKAFASKEEIDKQIEAHATGLGILPERWIELVSADRELDEEQVRKIVSNEVRYHKLPEEVKQIVRTSCDHVCVDPKLYAIVIRSRDDEQNWKTGKANTFETAGGLYVVRTNVELSTTRDGIVFSGNDLEFATEDEELFAAADEFRFVMDADDLRIKLKGNARLNMGDGGIMEADSIRYEAGENLQELLILEGNASSTSDVAEGSADRIEFDEAKMILTGNAALNLVSEQEGVFYKQYKGEKIEFDFEGENYYVDGVKQPDLEE